MLGIGRGLECTEHESRLHGRERRTRQHQVGERTGERDERGATRMAIDPFANRSASPPNRPPSPA
jgi:hypothetical protein